MGTFDVYVEGPADSSPDATRRLAGAMAARYGLPAAELLARLEKGRFRVKGNVDRATADTYARDLEAIGARVVIVGASAPTPHAGAATASPPATTSRPASSSLPPATTSRPASSSLPPATTSRPASSSLPPANVSKPAPGSPLPPATSSRPAPSSSLPPATTSRPAPSSSLPPATSSRPAPSSSLPPATVATSARSGSSSLPPANAEKSAPVVSSGLAAAFSAAPHEQPATSLGALDSIDMLSLSSLDGSDASEVRAPASFEPPAPVAPAARVPPLAPAENAAAATSQPIDRFSAPPAEEAFVVELAPEEIEYRERRRGSMPPATQPVAAPGSGPVTARGPSPTTPVAHAAVVASTARGGATPAGTAIGHATSVASEPARWRFAAGVLLAVALGFAPAHLVAAMREEAKFAQIDKAVIEHQTAAATPEAYAALDGFRAKQIERKTSERRKIALVAMGIWAVAAGLVAFVWFRLIPWDRR